jgi:uncharacterized protein with GYD domain
MPKYLLEVSYTAEGLKGLQKEGGSGRTTAVTNAVKTAGGKLEALYWSLGEYDCILVVDLPDTVSASALATGISATGLVRSKTTVLLTAEEMDAAMKKSIAYRGPGK